MTEVVDDWPFSAEAWILSWVIPGGILAGQSGSGTYFI